jgi:hypothetical protein
MIRLRKVKLESRKTIHVTGCCMLSCGGRAVGVIFATTIDSYGGQRPEPMETIGLQDLKDANFSAGPSTVARSVVVRAHTSGWLVTLHDVEGAVEHRLQPQDQSRCCPPSGAMTSAKQTPTRAKIARSLRSRCVGTAKFERTQSRNS